MHRRSVYDLTYPSEPALLKSPLEGICNTGTIIEIKPDATETSDAEIIRIEPQSANFSSDAEILHIYDDVSSAKLLHVEDELGDLLLMGRNRDTVIGVDSTYDILLNFSGTTKFTFTGDGDLKMAGKLYVGTEYTDSHIFCDTRTYASDVLAYPYNTRSSAIHLFTYDSDWEPGSILIVYGDIGSSNLDSSITVYYASDDNWAVRFCIDKDGNTGILTSSPTRPLHVAGMGRFEDLLAVRVDKGDYGGDFANYTPPSGAIEGDFLFAVDTNATNPGFRLYAYLDGAWHYVDLT